MFFCIGRISFGMGDGGRKDEHIAGFFDRHVPYIGLSVGQWIGADVV